MILKYKKLAPNASAPKRAHATDAGFDLIPVRVVHAGPMVECSFGLALEIPEGYVGMIFPRSSIYKTGWRLSNCVGIIDSGYLGEIKAFFDVLDNEQEGYKAGERCCQLVLVKIPEVELVESDELTPSERGMGGFGSTGKDKF